MAQFVGKTSQASSVMLGAQFWKKGIRIEGTVEGAFQTTNGQCYNVRLKKPVKVNGHDETLVSIGALKGFNMALQAAGVPNQELKANDKIILECTGVTDVQKGSPRVDFTVAIDRK